LFFSKGNLFDISKTGKIMFFSFLRRSNFTGFSCIGENFRLKKTNLKRGYQAYLILVVIWTNLCSTSPGVDWGQKTSAAKGFIKATKTLRKKPHITLKKPRNP
jgi:hypothetical protein